MKVVYETIETAIRKAIRSADENNRRIERIELTWWEMDELSTELPKSIYNCAALKKYRPEDKGKVGVYMGVGLYIA